MKMIKPDTYKVFFNYEASSYLIALFIHFFYRNEDIERLKLAEIGLKYDPTQKLHKM